MMLYEKRSNDTLLTYWLVLAVSALALAGVFALLLVSARSPIIQDLIPLNDLFNKSLTVHVNLSVLVWFLATGCLIWHIATPNKHNLLDKVIVITSSAGVIAFILAPFLSEGEALLNNYVPILNNSIFIGGIAVFLGSIFVQAVITFLRLCSKKLPRNTEQSIFHFSVLFSIVIYIIAMVAIVIAYIQLKRADYGTSLGDVYYELLFWGGGHILQLFYAQIMMISWLWMARISGFTTAHLRMYCAMFKIHLALAIVAIATFFYYPAETTQHLEIFTDMMRYFGGIAPILLALPILLWIIKNPKQAHASGYNYILIWSMVMFGFGGALAFMIHGVNTVIPAHYHGSIVAITMALMGIVCHTLPQLGFSPVRRQLLALQPCVYGVGQLMHIIGLAWSGGYGALRKTPGAMESLEGQAAMGLMGLGGLLSVIGGILFVYMCGRSLLKR